MHGIKIFFLVKGNSFESTKTKCKGKRKGYEGTCFLGLHLEFYTIVEFGEKDYSTLVEYVM